ncbi:hypothetical protein GCM10027344_26710 [Spelaeicoccus albus]|uniref:Integral membrane protein (TIGR01906 family) n=2 Tax=Spelaeicoccus albus TaxID=1280376 RepID=A0A7Z0D2Z1_9MICO|nr:integral membrane protein (TIGR01906 family) [Spelaeicoccus albus]
MTTSTTDTDDLVTRRLNSHSEPAVDEGPGSDDTGMSGGDGSTSIDFDGTESAGADSTGADPASTDPASTDPAGAGSPSAESTDTDSAGPTTARDAGKPSVLSDEEWAAVMADDAPATTEDGPAETQTADTDAPRSVDLHVRERNGSREAHGFLAGLARVWITISVPLVVIALAMRVVITPVFSWFEYKIRPGFPADAFGFTGDDRVHWASYVSGYLMNFDGSRFLSNLVYPGNDDKVLQAGKPVFKPGEVAHMHDVKTVIVIYFLVATILLIGSIIFGIYLARRTRRGLSMSLFSGSIVTLVFVIAVGVFAALRWNTFFSDFHSVFFKNGTWTFYDNDTLIRLYPDTFWTDAGIFIGGATVIVAILLLIFNWPRKPRGQRTAV